MAGSVLAALMYGNVLVPFKKAMFSYTNFPIIIFSIIIFVLFLKIKNSGKRTNFLKMLSASSFTVYLIHTHIIIFNNYIKGNFTWIGEHNALSALGLVILCAAGIYIVCTVIGILQIKLFKLLKIDHISERIVDFLKSVSLKAADKFSGTIDK